MGGGLPHKPGILPASLGTMWSCVSGKLTSPRGQVDEGHISLIKPWLTSLG